MSTPSPTSSPEPISGKGSQPEEFPLTAVFTDIVRSSEMKQSDDLGRDAPERDNNYAELIQTPHFERIRASAARHGGKVIDTIGDGFFLVFKSAHRAVRCGLDIQGGLANDPIPTPIGPLALRITIHTAEVGQHEGKPLGSGLDAAAKLKAYCRPGVILITSATYEIIRDTNDLAFPHVGLRAITPGHSRDLYEVMQTRKDDGNPESTLEGGLTSTDRQVAAGSLNSIGSLGAMLPPQLTPAPWFVGREEALKNLTDSLEPNSVTAVTGLPNSGKSELVAQAIVRIEEDRPPQFYTPAKIVFLDLAVPIGPHPVMRALAASLNCEKYWIGDAEDNQGIAISYLLGSSLPNHLGRHSPILLLENAEGVLATREGWADADRLLSSDLLRTGTAVLLTTSGPIPSGEGRRHLSPAVTLGALDSIDELRLLLQNLLPASVLLDEMISELAHVVTELLPGVVVAGAKELQGRIRLGQTPSVANAIDSMITEIEGFLVRTMEAHGCAYYLDSGNRPGPLALLCSLAVLGSVPFNRSDVESSGIPEFPFDNLVASGQIIMKQPVNGESDYLLSPVLRDAARSAVMSHLGPNGKWGDDAHAILDVLGARVAALEAGARTSELSPEEGSGIEEGISWLRRNAPRLRSIEQRLLAMRIVASADDLILPARPEDVDQRPHEDDEGRLSAQVARAILAVRSDGNTEEILGTLQAAADDFVRAQSLDVESLRGLDVACHVALRRFREHEAILKIREEVLESLRPTVTTIQKQSVALRKWVCSWTVNTASILVSSGRLDAARDLMPTVQDLVESLPPPYSTGALLSYLHMNARVEALSARLNHGSERLTHLRNALDFARRTYVVSAGAARWLALFLGYARQLSEELRTDDDRLAIVDELLDHVRIVSGENLGSFGRIQVASLLRDLAFRFGDQELQLDVSHRAVKIGLEAQASCESLAADGDGRPLLTLAKCLAAYAEVNFSVLNHGEGQKWLQIAAEMTRGVLESCPSTAAWRLHLGLQDDIQRRDPQAEAPTALLRPGGGLRGSLLAEIKRCQAWIELQEARGREEGELELWCHVRKWKAQGNLVSTVISQLLPHQDWNRLSRTVRQRKVDREYMRRRGILDGIGRKFEGSPRVFVSRAYLESQYLRWTTVITGKSYDQNAILSIYNDALKIWPGNHLLLYELAQYHRYIWDHDRAIELFTRVTESTADGDLQRRASTMLVESLLVAATYTEEVILEDEQIATRDQLLTRAWDQVQLLLGYRGIAKDVAVLRDRVALEIGEKIDWIAIHETFDTVIGSDYLDTLLSNLEDLLAERPQIPQDISALVRARYTNDDVLSSLGLLMLRKAELSNSADSMPLVIKAYAAFSACSLLEKSWSQGELPAISYRRARTILLGARLARSLNPFQADREGKPSLLHLAESRFQSVASRSVGGFKEAARQLMVEARGLINEIERGTG